MKTVMTRLVLLVHGAEVADNYQFAGSDVGSAPWIPRTGLGMTGEKVGSFWASS